MKTIAQTLKTSLSQQIDALHAEYALEKKDWSTIWGFVKAVLQLLKILTPEKYDLLIDLVIRLLDLVFGEGKSAHQALAIGNFDRGQVMTAWERVKAILRKAEILLPERGDVLIEAFIAHVDLILQQA